MTSLGASAPPFPGVASASTREGQTRLIGSGARRPSGPWGSSRALVEEHGQRAVEIAAWKGDHWSPSPLALAGHSIRQHTFLSRTRSPRCSRPTSSTLDDARAADRSQGAGFTLRVYARDRRDTARGGLGRAGPRRERRDRVLEGARLGQCSGMTPGGRLGRRLPGGHGFTQCREQSP